MLMMVTLVVVTLVMVFDDNEGDEGHVQQQ